MIPEISMILRQHAAVGLSPRFPVILQLFRVLLESLAAIPARSLTHGTHVACWENVFENHLSSRPPTAFLLKKCVRKMSYRCVWRTLFFEAQGDPKRGIDETNEDTRSFAIPTLRFAGNVSTWNPPSLSEGAYPQNSMVEQPRNQVSEMHFDKFPCAFGNSSVGRRASKQKCVPVLLTLREAMRSIKEVEFGRLGERS